MAQGRTQPGAVESIHCSFVPNHRETMQALADYREMVRLKAGVLIGTACQVGALVAGERERHTHARRLGEALGVAFQLQDDYLGVWGEVQTLGKSPSDLEERKRGLPVVLALGEKPEAVATLLATPGEVATAELLDVLDALDIRPRAEALAREAAGEALRALNELQLELPWEGWVEQMVRFVVARAV